MSIYITLFCSPLILARLMTTPPVPYCLYEKCLELEECGVAAAGFKGDVKRLREVFEKAVRDYGKTNIGKLIQ